MSPKREKIIQTGETLFIKHGMRRVSVEEICRQAGVSKPTFYKHFKNKEALARHIDEVWIAEALQGIDQIEEAEMAFPQKMKKILAIKQELSARPGPEFLQDLIDLDIDLSHAFERVMRFFVISQQNGDIREDIRPQFFMAAFNALNSMQYDPKIRALYDHPQTLAGDIFRLFYYGALSPGHRQAGLPESGAGLNPKDG
ncbi:TetR/AcrR family transcriptional regulator [Chloroflexota bacterium]